MSLITKTNIGSTVFSIEDASKAISFKQVATPNYRYMVHRLMGFSPDQYTDMEYDLSESSRIIDTEAIVYEVFRKKRQLILKNGFVFEGDKKNIEYIKDRLEEFEFVTQQTFRDFVAEVAENMVDFNNCFILKYRKEDISSGEVRSIPSGKEFKPIAGLYVLAAPTIDTANDPKTGRIKKYRHRITQNFSKEFKTDDIYHMFQNRRTGMTIATPPIEAVRDDILTLRSIEQYTEDMIRKNASPFMHVKVGDDKYPARILGDGTSEVDVYSSIIDNKDYSGGVATPHRVSVEYIGSESRALRLESYLAYFKQRVLIGLSATESDLGGTKVGTDSSLKDDVRAYQETIGNFFTNYIFTELLLESPRYKNDFFIPTEERVQLKFLDADETNKVKLESHRLNLYISGLITREAAIRGTDFTVEDLQKDLPLNNSSSINTNNSVKSLISNNITKEKSDKFIVKDSREEAVEYFDHDFDTFVLNLEEAFPIEGKNTLIRKLYERSRLLVTSLGEDEVNRIIESTMLQTL